MTRRNTNPTVTCGSGSSLYPAQRDYGYIVASGTRAEFVYVVHDGFHQGFGREGLRYAMEDLSQVKFIGIRPDVR